LLLCLPNIQTNLINDDTNYSDAATKHVGQLFFPGELIHSDYQLAPYHAHLSTLNRTLNGGDSVYSVANDDGYSAIISTELVGETLAEGLIGYITIEINKSASAIATTGQDVNVQRYLPTVSLSSSVQAASNTLDIAECYRANVMKL
jgi:hypothetical protein